MKLYRGLSLDRATRIEAGKEAIQPTSNGEFGNGSYYWRNDIAAGVMSALQYYGKEPNGWAVIEIEFNAADIKTQFPILNFVDNGTGKQFDAATKTAMRPVRVTEFGADVDVNLTFSEFRDINSSPSEYTLPGEKHTLPWSHYGIIAGPCAIAPKDVNLIQVKFAGTGIDNLNACKKKIVLSGACLSDDTFARVSNWKMEARNDAYKRYFLGKTVVNL
jgi:hypothetical protein